MYKEIENNTVDILSSLSYLLLIVLLALMISSCYHIELLDNTPQKATAITPIPLANATNYVFINKWGNYGNGTGQFSEPTGIAVSASGIVYVLDGGNNRVQKFDNNGTFITMWGSEGSGPGQFPSMPEKIAVDHSENVYVLNSENSERSREEQSSRIQKFDSNGKFIMSVGSQGDRDGKFNLPSDIAVDSQNNLYVADNGKHRIQKFDSNGKFVTKWGYKGFGAGLFNDIEGIAISASGNAYVLDISTTGGEDIGSIQKFDINGNFVAQWKFPHPLAPLPDIAVDSFNNLYVAEHDNRVEKFDNNGKLVTQWGGRGYGNGEFGEPIGIDIDSSGKVYVLGDEDNRVQVFAPSNKLQ